MQSQTSPDVLGHELYGDGPRRVIVLNDWLCDTSTWDDARRYLDTQRFTFVFADLRGYGRSRGRAGQFTLGEATTDVLALAAALGLSRFSVVGHSMSSLVALELARSYADRVERVVVLTPPPPAGFGVDDATLAHSRELALADDAARLEFFIAHSDGRLAAAWPRFKVARWRETADAEAVAAYVPLFARDGLPASGTPIRVPVLAITGEADAPPMRAESVAQSLGAICENLAVTPLAGCGHYPMQEMPPHTVGLVERFLA